MYKTESESKPVGFFFFPELKTKIEPATKKSSRNRPDQCELVWVSIGSNKIANQGFGWSRTQSLKWDRSIYFDNWSSSLFQFRFENRFYQKKMLIAYCQV